LTANREKARAELKLSGKPLVLVFGGSLGAAAINFAMVDMLSELDISNLPFQLLFATGKNYYQRVLNELQLREIDIENNNDIRVVEYIYDMDIALSASDLVICRCGAATISELCALGKASILIPSPNVTDNHQEYNGRAVADIDGGALILEKDLVQGELVKEISKMLDDRKFEEIGKNAKKLGIIDATEKIYQLILELNKKN